MLHCRASTAMIVRVLLLSLAVGSLRAESSLEHEIKAAMLYNFTRFVEWPESAWRDKSAPLVLGIAGADPFGRVLDEAMRDKTYNGRAVQIRRMKSLDEARSCHVVFVSRSERAKLNEVLRALQPLNVLTVSDMEEFVRAGGMIGFLMVDNRVRFEISPAAASRAGITISSKLLRLAVTGDRATGGL